MTQTTTATSQGTAAQPSASGGTTMYFCYKCGASGSAAAMHCGQLMQTK